MLELPEHLSVSQVLLWERCPQAYLRGRLLKEWSKPAAWLAQGTAVHAVQEALLTDGVMPEESYYGAVYANCINDMAEVTPNFDSWFASGPYDGEADIERRYDLGWRQCQWLENFLAKREVWIAPDGTPGVEMPFEVVMQGVLVKGFIDLIIVDNGVPVVVDLKTGNKPGDPFQLQVYAVALNIMYGVEVKHGMFLMSKHQKWSIPYPIVKSFVTADRIFDARRQMVKAVDDYNEGLLEDPEPFPAKPEANKCRFCDVQRNCPSAMVD